MGEDNKAKVGEANEGRVSGANKNELDEANKGEVSRHNKGKADGVDIEGGKKAGVDAVISIDNSANDSSKVID